MDRNSNNKIRRLSQPRPLRLLLGFTLVAALFCPSRRAYADNYQHAVPCSLASVTISVPDVTISDPNVAIGSLLGSSGTATANFNCPNSGNSDPWHYYYLGSPTGTLTKLSSYSWPGLSNYPNISIQGFTLGSSNYNSALGGLLYTTNLGGISLLLTNTHDQLTGSSGTLSTINYGSTTASVRFKAQLVRTSGTLQAGKVTSPNQLMDFENFSSGYTVSTPTYGSLTLNPITVSVSACTVNTASQNFSVPLPTVLASTLNTAGATNGKTPFQINLTCQAGSTALITMHTNSYYGKSDLGVIAPSAGSAANVGVQLLQGNPSTPVNFDQAQSVGNTPSGTLSIPFFAQYYATGTAGGGQVSATVTFTMSYQ